jgi:hypothetical protein
MSSLTNNTGMHVENIVLIWEEAAEYNIIILCRLNILLNALRRVFNIKTHRDGTPI